MRTKNVQETMGNHGYGRDDNPFSLFEGTV